MNESEFARRVAALGGQLYITGGWVRDHLIGRTAQDKDYVVCGLDAEMFQHEFHICSVGQQFPVYLLNIGGQLSEVALARTERKTGTGHHGFEARFSPDITIEEDLYRRDTRMNSMAICLPGNELVDPFGGQSDIERQIINATSPHFRDDPLRALRAARQAAQLSFDIAPGTIAMMSGCSSELAQEPSERVFAEMHKALASPQPEIFFTVLLRAGILDTVFPELAALNSVKYPLSQRYGGHGTFKHTMEVLHRTSVLTTNPATRFAALVHDLGRRVTPQSEWRHHTGHEEQGLAALEQLNRRMTLPRLWYRFACFIIVNHIKISRLCHPNIIVKTIEEIRRGGFKPKEIAAVIQAKYGTLPDFLQRYDLYTAILDEERGRLEFPAHLRPQDRGRWLRICLAKALILRLSSGK